MQPLLNIAVNAARQAGDVILRSMDQIHRLKIMQKGEGDFFSEVDVKAEQVIIQTIHKSYPQHGIIAEESGSYNEDAETVWIIDPLDGTKNYLHSFPFFAVSIAVKVKNRIEHAVVYDPIRHESFSASRGRGARLNDHRMRVSKASQINQSLLAASLTSSSWRSVANFAELSVSVRRTGSAALDLAYVAAGRLDGFWGYSLKPWDLAAGSLLIQEAGGLISDLQGGESYLKHGDVAASTPKIFKSLLQTILRS